MVEPGRGRDDGRARLGSQSQIAEVDQRERRLPGDQDQGAAFLELHIGRTLDQ